MATIQKRRGTAAQWTTANPVLAAGEEGFESDTRKSKVGDGVTAWITLPYTAAGGGAVSDAAPTVKGVIQLAGDLAGTAAAPTVPGLATNAANIATNTTNIATNAAGIATNVTAIATKSPALVEGASWVPSNNTILSAALAPAVQASYPAGSVVTWFGGRWLRKAAGNEPQFTRSAWTRTGNSSPKGVYVPENWGEYLLPKLVAAKAGTALVRVAGVGDSLLQGWLCSDTEVTSWWARCRTAGQLAFNDGGSGFKSVADSPIIDSDESNSTTWGNKATNFYTLSASGWAAQRGIPDGPGATVIASILAGATATQIVRGTLVEVLYGGGGAICGSMTITIDGTLAATINTATTPSTQVVGVWTSGTLSAGNHTVVIAGTDSTALGIGGEKHVYLFGISGRNATGIVFDKYAHAGFTTAFYANPANSTSIPVYGRTYGPTGTWQKAGTWSGGTSRPCDLVLYCMGANDIGSPQNFSGDTVIENLKGYLIGVRATTTADTEIIVVVPHFGQFMGLGHTEAAYTARLRGLAEQFGAAIINMYTIGRSSWEYQNAQGRWGSTTAPGGLAGTDAIHMSDAGHLWQAQQIASLLAGTS
jgi:hypothetical protein